ncbi:arginine decarboxylase [Magnetococcus marinus]|uniref:arginine decarboxylase n=1 Tax=Magnetococcus marinus TaxID=1124597 RepID=UPI00031DF126|nr:arginine decarboxylase [Magnetococcus marinus]
MTTQSAPATAWTIEESMELYRTQGWGLGYVHVDAEGDLTITPGSQPHIESISLPKLVDDVEAMGFQGPMLIRFGGILQDRITRLNRAFTESRSRLNYAGHYQGVYPVKVNQDRHVVSEVVASGTPMGLEVGSKPELVLAMAYMDRTPLIICNGYKDRDYIELALRATGLGFPIFVVVDRLEELAPIIDLAKSLNVSPNLGLRARLLTEGVGKWSESAGGFSKFGLTAGEILLAVNQLEREGLKESLKLLHMHQGSQISLLDVVRQSAQEIVRFYLELRKMGCPIEYVDVGGGLGVDYEGLSSSAPCSVNYSLGQYADALLGVFAERCREAGAPEPNVVTESGRALTAPHAVLVVEVMGWSEPVGRDPAPETIPEQAPEVQTLHTLAMEFDKERADLIWEQALMLFESIKQGFVLGRLDLTARSIAERVMVHLGRLVHEAKGQDPKPESRLQGYVSERYLTNFSMFQSLPDAWAIGQLFPIMPLQRLHEEPAAEAILQDLTCDSDGQVKRFIGVQGENATLPVHHPGPTERYRLGFFLVGAYQEILGDYHNLFGDTHVVEVGLKADGSMAKPVVRRGQRSVDVLKAVSYEPSELYDAVGRLARGACKDDRAAQFIEAYARLVKGCPYLTSRS